MPDNTSADRPHPEQSAETRGAESPTSASTPNADNSAKGNSDQTLPVITKSIRI